MPLPHRDPAVTAYVRHVVIGLDNSEPTKTAARLGVSGAWVVNVRDGHRGVGLDALRKIAQADFGGSLDRLEAAARAWAAAHPEALEPPRTAKPEGRAGSLDGAGTSNLEVREKTPHGSQAQRGATRSGARPSRAQTSSAAGSPVPAGAVDNLRAARERLLDRGYPRDAVNEALLSTAPGDTSDVLLVFDLAERQLIADGYEAKLHRALRRATTEGRTGAHSASSAATPSTAARPRRTPSESPAPKAPQSSAPQPAGPRKTPRPKAASSPSTASPPSTRERPGRRR